MQGIVPKARLEEFLRRAKTEMTLQELEDEILENRNIRKLFDGDEFIAFELYPDSVLIHAGFAPNDGWKWYEKLKRMFPHKRIYFLTRRDPDAWVRGTKGKMRFLGHLMEIL
jgi:hypothetical protein